MIYFTNGEGRESQPDDAAEIIGRLAEHDAKFWNGRTGQSAFERRQGDASRYLYVSLVPDAALYWLVLQFEDRSTISPRDPQGPAKAHRMWIGGQPIDVGEDYLVDAGTARNIAEHFVRTGDPYPDVNWAFG